MITKRDDDYLICKEYQSRIDQISSEYPDFITFQHSNGNHYFAWVHDGQVVLRSEAYPDEERMIRGIKAIQKNWDLVERYSVDEQHGVHFLVLWGGGDHQAHTGNMGEHNEIGRSCPKKSREELHNLLHGKGEDFAQKVIPIDHGSVATAAAVAGAAALASDHSEDLVEKIEEKVITPSADLGKVAAAAATVAATSLASSTSNDEVKTKGTPASGATYVDDSAAGGGFKWWYLLPLLLLPLLWKMCNKGTATAETSAAVAEPAVEAQPAAADTSVNSTAPDATAAATPAAAPDCNLNWILFDFDKYDIRSDAQEELKTMADILKGNADYVGDLSAHTDAKGSNEYNDRLSKNRAEAAKSVLVSMGIDASRITTSASSEGSPLATNTDDDSGRKFNRRVELRVKDKSGKEICESIPPAVPSSLKQ
jgi:outer membrane protein OmpA-like peptidoglycan-associated protein/uncharacterized protein YegP (UPF0339 family)